MIGQFLWGIVRQSDYPVRFAGILCLLGYAGDLGFSVEMCELLLENYDLPGASGRIFRVFLAWLKGENVEVFVAMMVERLQEIKDFLDSSEVPEAALFARYLPLIEDALCDDGRQ
jgi:hypothetical protein